MLRNINRPDRTPTEEIIDLEEIPEPEVKKPDWYYGEVYKEGVDPEVTCWHCKKTFLCDCQDATCRLCRAPFDKKRCGEFNFIPKLEEVKSLRDKIEEWFIANHRQYPSAREWQTAMIKGVTDIAYTHFANYVEKNDILKVFDNWNKDKDSHRKQLSFLELGSTLASIKTVEESQ